jgi:hypothetical protein
MITAETIAKGFDHRAIAQMGWLDGEMVFRVEVWGGHIGYIMPPKSGGCVWGVNLVSGLNEMRGYFAEEEGNLAPFLSLNQEEINDCD